MKLVGRESNAKRREKENWGMGQNLYKCIESTKHQSQTQWLLEQ
jgi:hypothetical protein